MNKVLQAIQSRTFWTIVVLVAVNTLPQLKGLVSQHTLDVINTVLGFVATYFHVNPSQNYNQTF